MKNVVVSLVSMALAVQAHAADLTKCNNKYLVSVTQESQPQVHQALSSYHKQGYLTVGTFNPKVGPYTVYGLEASTTSPEIPNRVFQLMTKIQQLPGAIVECDQVLTQF